MLYTIVARAVERPIRSISLSVFGGNFVLAKVRRCLISVCCSELRGVRFSEVRNVFYGKINRGQVSRPLYRGCPLFGVSVIRGFTVNCIVKLYTGK